MRISDWSSDVCSSDLGWKSQDRRSLHAAPDRDGVVDAIVSDFGRFILDRDSGELIAQELADDLDLGFVQGRTGIPVRTRSGKRRGGTGIVSKGRAGWTPTG